MKRIFRFILPPLVLLAGIAISTLLIGSGPEADRQRPQTPPPTVEVLTVQPQTYQIRVASRGTVSPRTESTLVAEVAGSVVSVSDDFYPGGFFEAGDLLLQIDDRNYRNALTIAGAEVTLKRLALAEEAARGEQARRDLEQFRIEGEPAPLLLRIPQLEHAKAALEAATAQMRQAEINLERTRVVAPYAGRILSKEVDLGQYLSPGTRLAQIYASDALEVRLPLTDEQLRYVTLPEIFRDGPQDRGAPARVEFSARFGGETFHWSGELVRTEGSIDVNSRQLFVVARIDAPYLRQENRPQLKIGQFVEARIQGHRLENVYRIPRQAVHGEATVHIITPENLLERRELEVLWRDTEHLVVSGPLAPGEQISVTRLPFAADGIRVRIAGTGATDRPHPHNRQGLPQ